MRVVSDRADALRSFYLGVQHEAELINGKVRIPGMQRLKVASPLMG